MAKVTRLDPDGLLWLAQCNPDKWLNSNGEPCVARIARDAGVNRTHLHNVIAERYKPGPVFVDKLCDLAETTGVSWDSARKRLFHRVDAGAEGRNT